MELIIESDGQCRCIYDEAIDLHNLGHLKIQRGSHVEPNGDGNWTADLSPIPDGPLLGPFKTRTEALNAEAIWLREHWLGPASGKLITLSTHCNSVYRTKQSRQLDREKEYY